MTATAPLRPAEAASSKREAVKQFLRGEARSVGVGGRLPTVRDLSRKLGVAKATLHAAMDDLEDEKIIVRRRGSGIYVSENLGKKSIGLVFGANIFSAEQSGFYAKFLDFARRRAASHDEGFSFFLDVPEAALAASVPVHLDLVDALERRRLHGLLLVKRSSPVQEDWLRAQGVPVVSLATLPTAPNSVGLDYAELVRLGVRALVRQGCRRIGLITALDAGFAGKGPTDAYRAAMAAHGLPVQADWVWARPGTELDAPASSTRAELGGSALVELCGAGALDGLVIDDDRMAHGALAAAHKLGLGIGSDLKIASHANKGCLVPGAGEVELTLLEVEAREIAAAAFGMLERLMAGQDGPAETILVPPRLRLVRPWPLAARHFRSVAPGASRPDHLFPTR